MKTTTREKTINDHDHEAPEFRQSVKFRRLRSIIRVIEVIVLSFCFLIFSTPVLAIKRLLFGKAHFLRSCGFLIARFVESLGPVPVKFAQMASYRFDLLPNELLAPLGKLQDRVGGRSARLSRKDLDLAIGRDLDDIFRSFDENPIGIGSVANVYKAIDFKDRLVAVKIVRADAINSIELDLVLMKAMLTVASKLPVLRDVPVLEVFDYVAEMIRNQSDMREEARNLQKFRAEFSADDRIRFPEVYSDLTNRRTLIMSFVSSASKITNENLSDKEFRDSCDEILRALYFMMFKSGHIHCDLHPGNIFVLDDGAVCLIDAGMTGQLAQHDRQEFRRFFVAFALRDKRNFANSIISSAINRPASLDVQAVFREAEDILDAFCGLPAGKFLIAEFVYRLFELQRRHGLYGAPAFVNAIWALVMLEGIVRDRYPDLDFQAAAIPYFTSGMIEDAKASI